MTSVHRPKEKQCELHKDLHARGHTRPAAGVPRCQLECGEELLEALLDAEPLGPVSKSLVQSSAYLWASGGPKTTWEENTALHFLYGSDPQACSASLLHAFIKPQGFKIYTS